MGNSQGKDDIAALHKRESKLSVEKRRKRYKCGKSFKTVKDFTIWEEEAEEILKKGWRSLELFNSQRFR